MSETFPRQQARTRRFSIGVPRSVTVAPGGDRVLFLRSAPGRPEMALWELDAGTGVERLVADPAAAGPAGDETPEERARRERRRERGSGIVAYSTDRDATVAAWVTGGALQVVDVASGVVREVPVAGPAFDPRLDPGGRAVAWCRERALVVAGLDGAGEVVLGAEDDPGVTWGQAEFVAAEEMGRDRGFWWAPDGGGVLAARVDVGPVATWWIADPAEPARAPVAHRYPAAGTADAEVTLWFLGLDGTRTEIVWDRAALPYLAVVEWGAGGPPLLVVEARDHHRCAVLEVDVATGATTQRAGLVDDAWVDWPAGLPTWTAEGALAWCDTSADTLRLTVDGVAVTPEGLQVHTVVPAGPSLLVRAGAEPTTVALWRWSPAGLEHLDVVAGDGPGLVGAVAAGGDTLVAATRTLAAPGTTTTVHTPGGTATITSLAETPLLTASVRLLEIGPRRLRTGVVLPRGHRPGERLPVLMFPYGGPGAQRVMADQALWLEAQWRADQGFAVVVADGRGTPGRGPAWTREVHLDLAGGVLDDQVEALTGAAAVVPELDLDRVGITGWSFGGYLAALAVLRRPDVFHAAVAGAPVTDWRLYDTYYTERFLGHPDTDPAVYDRSSLIDDAPALTRPLLIIHGLVDDNVVVAHSLRLSRALLAAGRPHAVLPLSGVTHMASSEEVEEHLLVLQTRFLADALGV